MTPSSILHPPSSLPVAVTALTVEFTHHGRTRTLAKHPVIAQKLRQGLITIEDAKLKPWYLRLTVDGKERQFAFKQLGKDAVIREVRDFLNTREQQPNDFAQFLAAKAAARGLTVGTLAAEWIKAGCPHDDADRRAAAAATTLEATLNRALPYWQDKPTGNIEPRDHALYVAWRRQHKERGEGSRSADLELGALSSLFDWARLTGRVKTNPFAERKRFHKAENVRHCHEFAPRSDDDFHAVLRGFWRGLPRPLGGEGRGEGAEKITVVAGAWLCFTGLTGLRPEEPLELMRVERLDQMPTDPKSLTPGTIFPRRDGTLWMRVHRNKHGQNPFVHLHPAAWEFLQLWAKWLQRHDAERPGPGVKWFPGITPSNWARLNKQLEQACAELKLGDLKPKGFGRAFYVRCRRSDGIDDSQISQELGQTTNGKLIRDTYGDPDDLFASGLFDWRPSAGLPAWDALRHVPVILAPSQAEVRPGERTEVRGRCADTAMATPSFGGYGNDTAAWDQDTGKMPQPSGRETGQNLLKTENCHENNRQCSPLENENPLVKQGD